MLQLDNLGKISESIWLWSYSDNFLTKLFILLHFLTFSVTALTTWWPITRWEQNSSVNFLHGRFPFQIPQFQITTSDLIIHALMIQSIGNKPSEWTFLKVSEQNQWQGWCRFLSNKTSHCKFDKEVKHWQGHYGNLFWHAFPVYFVMMPEILIQASLSAM